MYPDPSLWRWDVWEACYSAGSSPSRENSMLDVLDVLLHRCRQLALDEEVAYQVNLRELGPLLIPADPSGKGVSGPVATGASWDLPACWAAIA